MPEGRNEELFWYLTNRDELAKQYPGKVLVIRGQAVAGVHDTWRQAIADGEARFGIGTFLVEEPGKRL